MAKRMDEARGPEPMHGDAAVGAAGGEVERRSTRKKVILGVGGVVALALLVWAVNAWLYGRSHQSTNDAYVQGHIVPVLARVGGYVEQVGVAENEQVVEGQPLVTIDPSELEQRVRQAEADLAAAQASAGQEAAPGQAQSQVEQARRQQGALAAQIDAAQANADKAQADLRRMQRLADRQIVSQQQLEAAQTAAAAAVASVRALEQQRGSAGAGISGAQAGVRVAQARVQAAQAALDAARLQLSYATVTAPVAGQVAKRSVERGQLLQPGQPLMSIVADSGVYVAANFKETQTAAIHAGDEVALEVDAYGGCEAKGEVESIAGATGSQFALLPADNATGNFTKVVQRIPVRIRVTDGCGDDRPLRPGMSVTAHVATG